MTKLTDAHFPDELFPVEPAPPELIDDVDAAQQDAARILDEGEALAAKDGHRIVRRFVLFSGGNDSTSLVWAVHHRVDEIVHIDTTIGIPETQDHVRRVADQVGLPLTIIRPPYTYEQLVTGTAPMKKDPTRAVFSGFPGPAAHHIMFAWLKERALRTVQRAHVQNPRKERIIYVAGTRRAESARRARNVQEYDRVGSVMWVSPISNWSTRALNDYLTAYEVPRNPVSDLIHMSGECLCGAYAHRDELEELRFWFPDVAARIDDLEAKVAGAGIKRCKWGNGGRPPTEAELAKIGALCSSCDYRADPA